VNLAQDKALAGYATIIVVVAIIALVALSVTNHAADIGGYITAISPAVTGLVVLFSVRPKAKQAAEAATYFADDQIGEIETIVIRALTDYDNGKRPPVKGKIT